VVTHLKTIGTILTAIAVIWFLGAHPNLAWRAYQALWGLIGLATLACIYWGIHMVFEPLPPLEEPEEAPAEYPAGYEW
jgi:hypothetical protein